ncbi:MAG: squalene/phytoene synthase family protein [Verrucomicrobia bacterium]|nr:squalene/phytoene synthase family protein [Verrucomicrobiota bacterium]
MNAQLRELLKGTSRSFYLTLRVLPAAVRPQIGLAYLLARTADTIADTELVPPAQRLAALHVLRERILGASAAPLDFGELARSQAAPAERALLENVEFALVALRDMSADDTKLIRPVLDTITSGQELDLRRFAPLESKLQRAADKLKLELQPQPIIALQTDAELDDYTYRVAGCVGEFWTKLCRAHVFQNSKVDDAKLLADGIRFGKGLQLVNILRDLPVDLRKGRCYLTSDSLAEMRLKPADLLQPANATKFRPLFTRYLELAESHLAAGWNYTNAIPGLHVRLRLACAWPVLIGMKTLARLRQGNVLDPQQRIKITRAEVKALILRSMVAYPWPPAWKRLFRDSGH